MAGIALAQFGLHPLQFIELTPIEFYYTIQDRKKTIENECEFNSSQTKLLCDVIRQSTLIIRNVQVPRKYQIRNPKRLMKFSWDTEQQKKAQTYDEMKSTMKLIAKVSRTRDKSKLSERRLKAIEKRKESRNKNKK